MIKNLELLIAAAACIQETSLLVEEWGAWTFAETISAFNAGCLFCQEAMGERSSTALKTPAGFCLVNFCANKDATIATR
ncbi:MAG: hypothetical protein ACU836_18625 [Gammaproteobacteria bacterium]